MHWPCRARLGRSSTPLPPARRSRRAAQLDVTVEFVASTEPAHSYNETNSTYNPNSGGIYTGTLTITTNDPVHPTESVNLSGWWQYRTADMEPSLQSLVNTLAGYDTQIASTYMNELTQTNPAAATYYGEEVNSPYWTMADPNNPVSVLQLAAWHQQSYTTASGDENDTRRPLRITRRTPIPRPR